uniref:M15 family metallopeptidase n=1 Tax=Acetatifactor sp. TaxID=1872090 RepID=UPI0040579C4C
MKKSIEERVKQKLLNIGKKNQICSILILPILFAWVTFFRAIDYCKGNGKRFSMLAMTFVLYVVYSSFSFPLFITVNHTDDNLYGEGELASDVSLAEEEELNIEEVEILDDADILEGLEFDETSHGMEIIDRYAADDILKSTEDREKQLAVEEDETDQEASEEYEDYEFSKDDWRLVLINKQNSIPDDYTFELGNITSTMRCDERIIDDLRDMLQAAKDDDVNLVICSPYRDDARQEYLFNRKITRYMNQGMSFVEAHQLASQAVTVPGASEHQIGLALDIVCDEFSNLVEEFGETDAGIWLAENSYRYGFIVRYPKGKEYITGIEYEPWHFRYVGVEAATVITKNGITLEEFWEELE